MPLKISHGSQQNCATWYTQTDRQTDRRHAFDQEDRCSKVQQVYMPIQSALSATAEEPQHNSTADSRTGVPSAAVTCQTPPCSSQPC